MDVHLVAECVRLVHFRLRPACTCHRGSPEGKVIHSNVNHMTSNTSLSEQRYKSYWNYTPQYQFKKHYSNKWPCLNIYFLLKKWAQSHELFTGNRIYELWIINRSSINCMSRLPWPSPVSSWRYPSPPGAARDSAVHWTNSQTSPLETAGTRLSSASAKRESEKLNH